MTLRSGRIAELKLIGGIFYEFEHDKTRNWREPPTPHQ